MIGAWRAAQKWRPDGGMAFDTWCYQAIRRAIIDGNRQRSGWKRFGRIELFTIDVEPAATDMDDPERRAVAADAIRRLRAELSGEDRTIFDGLIAGRTQVELAGELGVHFTRVCQRVAKIRERLDDI
jgi:RNA polymerase sigma factor (sigma-70 family)